MVLSVTSDDFTKNKVGVKIPSVGSREFVWNKTGKKEKDYFILYTSLENEKNFISFHYEIKS